jgi:putative colanic acid biosynthesis acetyltransferase WcaF
MNVDLARYNNDWYSPGRGRGWQILWFFLGLPLLRASWIPVSGVRRRLLGLFGAKIGPGVVIKPGVRVKYPWLLEVGAHAWIGEDAWIDNLAPVTIGPNCCLSQGVYLCTGNHDWSDPHFGLQVRPITLENSAWVGARAVVCPGVRLGPGAVLSAGSVAQRDIPAWEVHTGNPAQFVRVRHLRTEERPRVMAAGA